ncbi:MAG: hypothetical protein FWC79_03255 [Oscillospiraceae bacterium]|nr:hypothetical protein [Oscillospiraceae bacterium]
MSEIVLTNEEITDVRAIQQEASPIPSQLRECCDRYRYVANGPIMSSWGTVEAGAACIRRINALDKNLTTLANSIASTTTSVDLLLQRSEISNNKQI